jgi:hypothetical protein
MLRAHLAIDSARDNSVVDASVRKANSRSKTEKISPTLCTYPSTASNMGCNRFVRVGPIVDVAIEEYPFAFSTNRFCQSFTSAGDWSDDCWGKASPERKTRNRLSPSETHSWQLVNVAAEITVSAYTALEVLIRMCSYKRSTEEGRMKEIPFCAASGKFRRNPCGLRSLASLSALKSFFPM